jgi:hypothetical protein
MKNKFIILIGLLFWSYQGDAQFLKKLKEKVNEVVPTNSTDAKQKEDEKLHDDAQSNVNHSISIQKCPEKDLQRVLKENKKGFDITVNGRRKGLTNKGNDDEVIKLFTGYQFKGGFTDKKSEIYAGPTFAGKVPNGTQDRYSCFTYDGLKNRKMGAIMYVGSLYEFNNFWNDTAYHFVKPIACSNPAGYVPARFLGQTVGTAQDYRNDIVKECGDPDDVFHLFIYQMQFQAFDEYVKTLRELDVKAQKEVNEYNMADITDALYYDYYYGKNKQTKYSFNEDVIKRNGDKWPIEKLEAYIDLFSYSKHVDEFGMKLVDNSSNVYQIKRLLNKYPNLKYDKTKLEQKLVGMCNDLQAISAVKSLKVFESSKPLEKKAFEILKANRNAESFEMYLALYANGSNAGEVRKMKADYYAKIAAERLERIKREGLGGIDLISGEYSRLFYDYWVVTYNDGSTSEIKNEKKTALQFLMTMESDSKDYDCSFIIDRKKYLFQNTRNAALALYKIQHGSQDFSREGLFAIIDLDLEERLEKQKQIDKERGSVISSNDKINCDMKRSAEDKYYAKINLTDDGSFFTKILAKSSFSLIAFGKNQNVLLKSSEYDKLSGYDAIKIQKSDLPATITINFKGAEGVSFGENTNKIQSVQVAVTETGFYKLILKVPAS